MRGGGKAFPFTKYIDNSHQNCLTACDLVQSSVALGNPAFDLCSYSSSGFYRFFSRWKLFSHFLNAITPKCFHSYSRSLMLKHCRHLMWLKLNLVCCRHVELPFIVSVLSTHYIKSHFLTSASTFKPGRKHLQWEFGGIFFAFSCGRMLGVVLLHSNFFLRTNLFCFNRTSVKLQVSVIWSKIGLLSGDTKHWPE